MSQPASKIALEFWSPPLPSAGRKRANRQRMLVIGVVIAMHIVLALMIVVRPDMLGMDSESAEAKNLVFVTSDLTQTAPIPKLVDLKPLASPAPRIADFARRARVAPGKSERVILAVKVMESGVAGDIRVAVSSGSRTADALAIEYARALRWNPADVQGRKSGLDVRLPVVLALPD
jgi:TonB family protein